MIVLRNAQLLQFDPPLYAGPRTIVIDGSSITSVTASSAEADRRQSERSVREIDCGGRIVMPGPVCGHHHFYSGLARALTVTLGPMPDFVSVLKRLWWRLDRALTREILEATAEVTALEAVKSGTTAVVDHHASPAYINGSLSTLAEGFRRFGLRGILCYETTDRHGLEDMRAGVAENARFAAEVAADPAGRDRLLAAAVGAHAPFTLSDESLETLAETVQTTGTGIHIHAAEDRFDSSHGRLRFGSELLERLERFGLLSERAIVVHGVHLGAEDIQRLNAADATLAHNCRSNMNNGVGYNHRLPQYRRVVIGTDGIGSNMFEELKFAYFKHRDAGGPLGPDAYARFLCNGNTLLERYFGRPFGRLEEGCTADLVISDYRPPTPLSEDNLAGHLVYGMQASDIRTVIINGQVVMQDHSIEADLEAVYARAQAAAADLWKHMERLAP